MAAPADSTVPISGGSGYNVRTLSQTINESGTDTTVQTQVMALGDPSGSALLDLVAGAVPVVNQEVAVLLKAMLLRLDYLCYHMDHNYKPPDSLGL